MSNWKRIPIHLKITKNWVFEQHYKKKYDLIILRIEQSHGCKVFLRSKKVFFFFNYAFIKTSVLNVLSCQIAKKDPKEKKNCMISKPSNCRINELSCMSMNRLSMNCRIYELSCLFIVVSINCHFYELSCLWIVMSISYISLNCLVNNEKKILTL